MKYLGHKNVSLLDGGMDDWVRAGNPTSAEPIHLPPANYISSVEQDLLASYSLVKSGKAQIIDARGEAEFEAESIPSSISIPYDRVLVGKRIKDDAALLILFSSLDKGRPVVVYTNTGVKASMIWLALTLLDYDASIYSWRDWQANSSYDIPGKTEGR
jgi:thiosulfate/3-mercaptopyruvate sulfurtransferase